MLQQRVETRRKTICIAIIARKESRRCDCRKLKAKKNGKPETAGEEGGAAAAAATPILLPFSQKAVAGEPTKPAMPVMPLVPLVLSMQGIAISERRESWRSDHLAE